MLSIFVNVKNGERYLERCLSSLKRFDDVVLLDNYSTDKTMEIVQKFPWVRAYQSEFMGMGKVRNLAASYAKHDWVMFVDCDEVLEPELVDTLLHYDYKKGNLYMIYRKNYYDGKLIETSSWGNDWIKRLYNKKDTQLFENEVHDSFVKNLPLIKIHGGSMIHFPYENVNQLINKMQFYGTLFAKQHYGKKYPTLFTMVFRAWFNFFKSYIIKRGFLDGYEGLLISVNGAVGVFYKYAKLYEAYHTQHFAIAINVNKDIKLNQFIDAVNNQQVLPERVLLVFNEQQTLDCLNNDSLKRCICILDIIVCENGVMQSLQHYVNNKDIDKVVLVDAGKILNNTKFISVLRKSLAKGNNSEFTVFVSSEKNG